jgi:transposase
MMPTPCGTLSPSGRHGLTSPPKANRKDAISFRPFLYKARSLVERFFNKAKQFRRIATRYDKLAKNYLAAVKLVVIRIWLRSNESTA